MLSRKLLDALKQINEVVDETTDITTLEAIRDVLIKATKLEVSKINNIVQEKLLCREN